MLKNMDLNGHEIELCHTANKEDCSRCVHYRYSEEDEKYGCYFLWDQCEAIRRGCDKVYMCDCCESEKAEYIWNEDKLCKKCLMQYLHDLVSDDPYYIIKLLNRDGVEVHDIDN